MTSMKIMRLKKAARVAGIALAVIAAVLAYQVIKHAREHAGIISTPEHIYETAQRGAGPLWALWVKGGAPLEKMCEALDIAVSKEERETAETLIQGGAPINGLYGSPVGGRAPGGRDYLFVGTSSPLLHAAAAGKKEMVELLLNNGADIEIIGNQTNRAAGIVGRALDHAIVNGHTSVVQLLVDRGAEVNHRFDGGDNRIPAVYGKSPLKLAQERGNPEIVDILEQALERKRAEGEALAVKGAPPR